jgi:hypothetical protein
MQKRCDRNRKRSKRRAIFCPQHQCYLDSVSPKYKLFADQVEHLCKRGFGRRASLMLIATNGAVTLEGEWLEAFWCPICQAKEWYHVRRIGERSYQLSIAPVELWQQVQGVIHPMGNPSVSEFTKRQARSQSLIHTKTYQYAGLR